MEIRLRFVRQRMGLVFHRLSRHALLFSQRLAQRSKRPLAAFDRPRDLSTRSHAANLQKLGRHLASVGRRTRLLRSAGSLGVTR